MFQISKSNVVDDMVNSNRILYDPGEKPDHCVSIIEYNSSAYSRFKEWVSNSHQVAQVTIPDKWHLCISNLPHSSVWMVTR